MKRIYKLLMLLLFVSCSPRLNTSSKIKGVYVYKKYLNSPVRDECRIILLEEKKFNYTCMYNHLSTTVKGSWELFSNNKIIIKVQEEDVMPYYPEKFYKMIDTFYIINDSSIISNNKIFTLDKKLN